MHALPKVISALAILLFVIAEPADGADWPQGAGPSGNFRIEASAPTTWSVTRDQNITWKVTLPETGQNTPVVCAGKVFFSTMKPVEGDAELGKDIIAWCVDAETGKTLWQRELPGTHPLRLSGCFSDSTSPPAVCDGKRVVFINASGGIACFDLDGEPQWNRDVLSVGRCLPFLSDGKFIFTRQVYPPEPNGNFPHKYKDSSLEMWTQLQALDITSGDEAWTSTCGVNMGCAILPVRLSDGRAVIVAGRGGGHGPPEKPDGISMIDANDGTTLWTLPLEGFMSTMSFRLRNDQVHLFHRGEHLSVDADSGKIVRRISIVDDVPVCRWIGGTRVSQVETIPGDSARMITQTSNLLVGRFHYFRSYTQPWIGRVNVDDGKVEYLELPLQLAREVDGKDQLFWYDDTPVEQIGKKKKKVLKPVAINKQAIGNEVKNSRGFVVMGDGRSTGNGWGHVAAPLPSVAGQHLYVPVMNGTVYVLDWDAAILDESAIIAINDLGPAGQSFTRASLSFADGRIYAHTIRELICIGE